MPVRSILTACAALAAIGLTACAGGGAAPPTSPASSYVAPAKIGFDDADLFGNASGDQFTVGVGLQGIKVYTDPTYGAVRGYFAGTSKKQSRVVTITTGETVVFTNVDKNISHTASLLGDASATKVKWPKTFKGSGIASPAGTDISTHHFSTGNLMPGASSPAYAANVPGFYIFGCLYHYSSEEHRDIIIVQ
jgi:plastocyanin